MKSFPALLSLFLLVSAAQGQPTNVLSLWPDGAPGALGTADKDIPTLTVFLPEKTNASGAAIVICPGGGYGGLAAHEGKDYALWLNAHGIAGFVLKYRLGTGGYHHPTMLHDAARALRTVRARASKWGVDPNRVGIMGSSAGGHLASTLLTHFDAGDKNSADAIERVSSRPDLGILCYPVITMGVATHGGSKARLLGPNPSPELVRELSNELARIAQKRASLITTIEMTCAGDRQPEGYIGVQFSELQTVMGDDGSAATPMREYPRIDSVYGNSPASKAGVRRGDVVLQIGGVDARRPVQLDKLLKIGTKLTMRVQREGSAKDLPIIIEKKPSDFNSDCANVDQVIGPDFDRPMIVMRAPRAPAAAGAAPMFPRTPMTPEAPLPPSPPMAGYMYGFTTSNSAIAGATLMPLDADWRATLGVDNGVLVTKVLDGTPAKDAGLRGSDVIISADGQQVASVRTLSRIVSNAKANSVKLQIIRAGKPVVIILRWQDQP